MTKPISAVKTSDFNFYKNFRFYVLQMAQEGDNSSLLEQQHPLLDFDEKQLSEFNLHTTVRKRDLAHWIAHSLSFFIIISLLTALWPTSGCSQARCWQNYNYYSPVREAVEHDSFVETRFKGSLWYQSPFKGPPTPETERAWDSAMENGMIAVSASDVERVQQNVSTAAQFPPAAGGGYIAVTVGTHQLHCLHYVWQDHHMAAFPAAQDRKAATPEMYERHYEHCVDYIRQSLMCNFDTSILTYNWVRDHNNPTPNANTMHKCVNWDKVQGWLAERTVQMPEGFEWHQPEGALSLDENP